MLTGLLSLIERFVREKDPAPHLAACRKVLMIDPAFIGDMVRSTPAYRAVKERIPGVRVDAFIFEPGRRVFRHNPHADGLHVVPSRSFLGQLAVALRLRRERYDVIINLFTGLRMNFFCLLMGAPLRVGYNYRHRGCFHNRRVPIATRTVQTIFRPEECLILLEKAFGWTIEDRAMEFTLFDEDRRAAGDVLAEKGCVAGVPLVGFHTNSNSRRDEKRWGAEKFAALADELISRFGVTAVFTGTEDDRQYVDSILALVRNRGSVVSTVGLLNLGQLGALIERCDLFVTLDTGPLHIAIAVKTPTFALVGGVPLDLVVPPGNPRFRGIAAGYADSAPLKSLRDLGVGEAVAAIASMHRDLKLFGAGARATGTTAG